jgi:porphobilinogen deaminase
MLSNHLEIEVPVASHRSVGEQTTSVPIVVHGYICIHRRSGRGHRQPVFQESIRAESESIAEATFLQCIAAGCRIPQRLTVNAGPAWP